jgi:hypothetical protein
MKLVAGIFKLLASIVRTLIQFVLVITLLAMAGLGSYIHHKGNQPMDVPRATPPLPEGITYWEFMADRIEAAREVKPQRCGVSTFAFFLAITPFYSVVYTIGGMRPESAMGRGIQPDASIPRWAAGLPWEKTPDVWWWVVENLSWSMLARHGPGCNFSPVMVTPYLRPSNRRVINQAFLLTGIYPN